MRRRRPRKKGVLFISHSSKDKKLVKCLVDLLCHALGLPMQQIVCSSVEGCKLASGVRIPDALQKKARRTGVFLALLSPRSMESDWVLFELGARWGSGKIRALRIPGVRRKSLGRPYKDLNAADATKAAAVHRLVHEINKDLQLPYPVKPWAYEAELRKFLALADQYDAKGVLSRAALQNSRRKLAGEVFAIEILQRPVEMRRDANGLEITVDRRDVHEMAISNAGKTLKVTELIQREQRGCGP